MALGAVCGGASAGAVAIFAAPTVAAILPASTTSPVPMSVTTSAAWLIVAGTFVGTFAALLPDIDTKGTLTRMLGPFGAAISHIVREQSYRMYRRRHRGMTHKPWFVVLSSLPWALVHPVLVIPAIAGGLSHIISDRVSSWLRRVG